MMMMIKIKKLGAKKYFFLSHGPICLIINIINFRGYFAHKCKISKGYLYITVKKIQFFFLKKK